MSRRPRRRARNNPYISRQQLYVNLDDARLGVEEAIYALSQASSAVGGELSQESRSLLQALVDTWRETEAFLIHDIHGR